MISYESYGEILFQKVASGCLLPFVQDGSSKKHYKISCSVKMSKKQNFMFVLLFSPPHSYRLKAGPMDSPAPAPPARENM